MADRDDPPSSYDPRSWVGGAERPRERDDGISFDPLSWWSPEGSESAAAPATTRSAVLAGAVAVLLFSLGGAVAYSARAPREAAPVQAEAQQPEVVVEQEK